MATFTIYCRNEWKDASGKNLLYVNYNHAHERDRFATGITIDLSIFQFNRKKCLFSLLAAESKATRKMLYAKQIEINRVTVQLSDSIRLCEILKIQPRPGLIKSIFNRIRKGEAITADVVYRDAQSNQLPTFQMPEAVPMSQVPPPQDNRISEFSPPFLIPTNSPELSPVAESLSEKITTSSAQPFSQGACEIINNVFHWYRLFLEVKKVEVDTGINSYNSTLVKLTETFPGKILPFSSLNPTNLNTLKIHLLKDIELRSTTIHKHFNNIKIFIKWVKDDEVGKEIAIPDGVKNIKIKPKYNDPIGLSNEQFRQFYEADLSYNPDLERTRDVFVFGVSIGGPRHGDLKKIGKYLRDNAARIKELGINYFEGKTGNAHKGVELNRFGWEVLEKYNYEFPHVPSNYRMNQNLKAIARFLKWRQLLDIPRFDLRGRVTSSEKIPLQEIFSTKFMRKVAISIDARMGVPVQVGMKRSGHTTFNAYRRYLDINNDDLAAVNTKWDVLHENVKPPQSIVPAHDRISQKGV